MSGPGTFAVIEGGRVQPLGLEPFEVCHDHHFHTVLVTNDLGSYLKNPAARAVLENYVDEVIETDITDSARVAAELADANAEGRLCGVFSVTEPCAPVAAAVARVFGLPGLDPEAAINAWHKQRTRQLCATAGVPVPEFAWVRSAAEARAAAARVGLPCVVKPPSDAGGMGVQLCLTADEAARHYEVVGTASIDHRGHPRPLGALVERYLAGYEVSVEVVRLGEAFEVIGVTDALFGSHPHFVEVGQTFPSLLPPDAQAACADVAIRALKAIGHDFGVAHVEVRVAADGPVLMEVNPRVPGAQITRLIYEATGLHLVREVIRMHAGLSPDLRRHRCRAAAVRYLTSPATGVVAAVHGARLARAVPGVLEIVRYADVGDTVRSPEHDGEVVGHVIVKGDTPGEAAIRADAAAGQLGYEVSASPTTLPDHEVPACPPPQPPPDHEVPASLPPQPPPGVEGHDR